MRSLTRLRMWIRALVGSRQLDADLDEELRYHLERQVALHVAGGMTPEEAHRAARLEFGACNSTRKHAATPADCTLSRRPRRTCDTRCAGSARVPGSPPWRSCRWPSASARTRASSPS